MGVCEERAMHWQQGEQFGAAGAAYDSPCGGGGGGGLSPTLPPAARCERAEGAGSAPPLQARAPSSAGSAPSSGCSTPSNNNHGARAACCTREQGEMCCGPTNPDLLPRPHSSFEHHIPKLEPEGPDSPYSPPTLEPAPPTAAEGGVAVCAGCGLKITDRYYLQAVDRRWHAACLQCCQCRNSLDGDITCFSRDGNIYCKKDYYRLFGMRRCGRCQAPILSSELVMRARELVFHVRCFTCEACGAPLSKGDHFGLRAGAVLCRLHFELPPAPSGAELSPGPGMFPAHHPPPAAALAGPFGGPFVGPGGEYGPPPLRGAGPGEPPRFGFEGPPGHVPPPAAAPPPPPPRQKGRPRKRKPKDLEGMTAGLDLNQDYLDSIPFGRSPGPPGMHGSQRTKRMRTSFKHHQLRTMKSYFAINHNPDAKDLKQLSQKTGLPKRVLQVWFQNARAKWRRMMLKQEGKSGEKCSPPDSMGEMDLYPTSSMNSMQSMSQHSPTFFQQGSPSSLDCA